MAVKDVESKRWILALFVRDDGERFLLGDGKYEFTDEQMHFAANVMANDVVEVQGNDGYMLAGQVRRPDTQSFDGYIGDSSTSKAEVEACRQAFFKFFRKNYFYKVIYIFSDGSAIQRKRGFLVDAPEAKELYQIYPKYHVALNFEDINYYYYDENADGDEIYGKSATISLNSTAQTGGLVWVEPGRTVISEEGTSFTIPNTMSGGSLSEVEVKGETEQQTYSGKNLVDAKNAEWEGYNATMTETDGAYKMVSGANVLARCCLPLTNLVEGTAYTISFLARGVTIRDGYTYVRVREKSDGGNWVGTGHVGIAVSSDYARYNFTFTATSVSNPWLWFYLNAQEGSTTNVEIYVKDIQIEKGSSATDYEPYVGGTASPNPDYPQEVQTVTGRQAVTISNGSDSQEYEVNLGKNLLDLSVSPVENNLVTNVIYDEATNTLSVPSNSSTASGSRYARYNLRNLATGQTYTIHIGDFSNNGMPSTNRCMLVRSYDGTSRIELLTLRPSSLSGTFTVPDNSQSIEVIVYTVQGYTSLFTNVQLELGSTATAYAPYFEPIELCKIGDCQDYIFKNIPENGHYDSSLTLGAWYLRKETGKVVLDGSSDEKWAGGSSALIYYMVTVNGVATTSDITTVSPIYSDRYTATTPAKIYNGSVDYGVSLNNTPAIIRLRNKDATSISTLRSLLATSPATVYYPLATPTTTQITNEALTQQLEALANATTYAGQTTFTVDGNGNLAATLAVELEITGGGGVLWEDNGAVWEEGKAPYSLITIESIDDVYPILTISGRTVNPILTDVSTGMAFQYNGTITESQVLRVDMLNKTATLNGTSVIGNVTGDWLYLSPGDNRITYTADNATAPNATLEWQEIVG